MTLTPLQQRASDIVSELRPELSKFHRDIWSYSESAWREYRSVRRYVDRLREEGFDVEEGSGGMPTAFHATWGDDGPEIGMYAEYDATPGYSQETVPYRKPREGLHPWAPGFTDAHSALGVGALAGAIATKRALQESGVKGRIHFFGEPAEKVCGSKAVHAAKGYYDTLDAAISYHPYFHSTAYWDITNCLYWSAVITFQCPEDTDWVPERNTDHNTTSHSLVRSPGAIDALSMMINTTKVTRENMFPSTGTWTLNEAILGASNATADNLAPRITQVQFSWRSPLIEAQEQILGILINNAKHVAGITNTEASIRWVTKTRPGLPNHALTTALFDNLSDLGAPEFGDEVVKFANEIEKGLGFEPSEDPFIPQTRTLISPQETDKRIRGNIPPWQECTGADDYTEYSWHAPTVRFFTARPILKCTGLKHFYWPNNSMNGLAAAMDPCWERGGQTIATTAVQLAENPELLNAAKAEFEERRARADERFHTPLLPKDFQAPIELPWPEYVQTARGLEWTLPTTDYFGERI